MIVELLPLICIVVLVGLTSGVLAGMLGIGGGAVIVPGMYFSLSVLGYTADAIIHVSIATAVSVIVVNGAVSVRHHNKRGAVDWSIILNRNLFVSWSLWIGIGAFITSLVIAPKLSGRSLAIIFSVLMAAMSLQLIFGKPNWRLRDSIPGGAAPAIGGSAIGGISSLMGIGGGTFTVPLMTMCGMPIHRAIGTASGLGLAISIPASIGFVISGWSVDGRPPLSLGYVNLVGFFVVAMVSYFAVPLGVHLSHKLDPSKLRRVFGLLMIVVAFGMIRKALA